MKAKSKPAAEASPKAMAVADLIDRYGVSDAELRVLSHALASTVQTEGWVLVERLLEKFRTGIPMAALRDNGKDGRTRDYYVGQVDFIEAFTALVRGVAAAADEKDAEKEAGRGDRLVKMLRPGRGPLL